MYSGSTITVEAAKMPAYRLINVGPKEGQSMTDHIKEVSIVAGSVTNAAGDLVDGDPYSCWAGIRRKEKRRSVCGREWWLSFLPTSVTGTAQKRIPGSATLPLRLQAGNLAMNGVSR